MIRAHSRFRRCLVTRPQFMFGGCHVTSPRGASDPSLPTHVVRLELHRWSPLDSFTAERDGAHWDPRWRRMGHFLFSGFM